MECVPNGATGAVRRPVELENAAAACLPELWPISRSSSYFPRVKRAVVDTDVVDALPVSKRPRIALNLDRADDHVTGPNQEPLVEVLGERPRTTASSQGRSDI
jgi:hypothetical protein